MWGTQQIQNLKGVSGIYRIINIFNNKSYVGMSNSLSRRAIEHVTPSNVKNKRTVLSKAFRKYGSENFFFELLELYVPHGNLFEREQHFIQALKPEYNMNEGGNGNKGHKLTNELKNKLRLIGKQQWENKTEDEKNKIIKGNLTGPKPGHVVSEKTKEMLRVCNTGKKQSQATILKRAEKIKITQLGNQNGNKPVQQILNGGVIATYPSLVIAAKEIKIHPSGITKAIKGGRQKTAGGFNWKYLN